MKIKYEFADGTVSEVEVEESIGAVIIEDRRLEDNLARKERYHCHSLDAVEFEGMCGVYKYASSPNFEILLFGYSVDGRNVEVVDVACGEEIPADIIEALSDESVIKWAFNAMFERVCLSNYLGEWLEPESWKCSMVWSATLGLPLSLENVGAVLGLEKQKLSEGKDLIRYFCVPCKPTKANGGRTRNLPEHDQEKWERFKAYNLRDVETEMQIQQRLVKFPVPDFVWEEYWQDQEINDRGIGVEAGDEESLSFMHKGFGTKEIIEECKRLDEAGMDYNFFYLAGIYGSGHMEEGVKNTAEVFNQLHPKVIVSSMLTVYPTSEVYQEIQAGNWTEETEIEKLYELRTLIGSLDIDTYFATMGASNCINVEGHLPKDRERMVKWLDEVIGAVDEKELRRYRENLRHL